MKTKKVSKAEKLKVEKRKVPLIAICDDHAPTAAAIAQYLEDAGYRTTQTYCAVDIMNICEKCEVPKCSGYEQIFGIHGFYLSRFIMHIDIFLFSGF